MSTAVEKKTFFFVFCLMKYSIKQVKGLPPDKKKPKLGVVYLEFGTSDDSEQFSRILLMPDDRQTGRTLCEFGSGTGAMSL